MKLSKEHQEMAWITSFKNLSRLFCKFYLKYKYNCWRQMLTRQFLDWFRQFGSKLNFLNTYLNNFFILHLTLDLIINFNLPNQFFNTRIFRNFFIFYFFLFFEAIIQQLELKIMFLFYFQLEILVSLLRKFFFFKFTTINLLIFFIFISSYENYF